MKQLWSKEEIEKVYLESPTYAHRIQLQIGEENSYQRDFDICVLSKKILPVDPVKDAENLQSIIKILTYASSANGLLTLNNKHWTEGVLDTQERYIRPVFNGYTDNGDGTFVLWVEGLRNNILDEEFDYNIEDYNFDATAEDFYANIYACEVSNVETGEVIISYEL